MTFNECTNFYIFYIHAAPEWELKKQSFCVQTFRRLKTLKLFNPLLVANARTGIYIERTRNYMKMRPLSYCLSMLKIEETKISLGPWLNQFLPSPAIENGNAGYGYFSRAWSEWHTRERWSRPMKVPLWREYELYQKWYAVREDNRPPVFPWLF